MAVPVARVHLKVAHAALPALLPTPASWKILPLLAPPPPPCVAAVLPNPPLAMPGRADADERWDARKTKPASAQASASSASGLRSAGGVVRSTTAGHGSSSKNTTSPPLTPPKPGRADSVARWDMHKKTASLPSSSSSSSGKWTISRASSAERWDVHKKPRQPQTDQQLDDDGESSSSSNDIDMDTEEEEEEEIVWKPRAMYAGPGFAVAAPESSMLPMPTTAFLVPVA